MSKPVLCTNMVNILSTTTKEGTLWPW